MNYLDKFCLHRKTTIITGGASGIGYETAYALGLAGSKVILLDIDNEKLKVASEKISNKNIEVETIAVDITDSKLVDQLVKDLESRNESLDVLVNCAGISRLHSTVKSDDNDWNRVFEVNVNGTIWISRAVGEVMVRQKKGVIVNLGSMSGSIVNRPQYAPSYMASKGAIHQLTKAMAVEWAKDGVRVNAVAPGYVATEMTLKMRDQPELFNEWLDMTPMGRCAEPSEVASAILFLSSDASSYITGTVLPVDGGYTAW